MKNAEELFKENYKGFTSTSVAEAYKKGFVFGVNIGRDDYRNMLEDVVNELDLSELAIDKHGPLGTPPAELVRLVLEEKDKIIAVLKAGGKCL